MIKYLRDSVSADISSVTARLIDYAFIEFSNFRRQLFDRSCSVQVESRPIEPAEPPNECSSMWTQVLAMLDVLLVQHSEINFPFIFKNSLFLFARQTTKQEMKEFITFFRFSKLRRWHLSFFTCST